MKLFLKYTEEVTMNKIKFLISFLFLSLILSPVYAQNYNWNNNLRTLFIDNGAERPFLRDIRFSPCDPDLSVRSS